MVCFRYISANTLHKGDDDDDDNVVAMAVVAVLVVLVKAMSTLPDGLLCAGYDT
jgi:hypothetical protein